MRLINTILFKVNIEYYFHLSKSCLLMLILFALGCSKMKNPTNNFKQDLELLNKYTKPVVLKANRDLCQLILVPEFQGRVMTSTSNGLSGMSYGWINDKLIRSGEIQSHINAYGGEDRFWVGPEGGQFSVFFKKGDPFDLNHWQTPAVLDTEPFQLDSLSKTHARLSKIMNLVNYSGYNFRAKVDRKVSIFNSSDIEKNLDISQINTYIRQIEIKLKKV